MIKELHMANQEIIDQDTYRKIKKIGGKRLEEIMTIIEKFLDGE